MAQDSFYELTRRRIPRVKHDGMYLSWHDSIINVRTDRGMTFFEFSYNLECVDKTIDVLEFSLPIPKTSPASKLCDSEFIREEMPNYEYTEMMIDSSFWPHNKSLMQEMTTIIMSAWSPIHFIENRSVLAILNNIGGVEFFMQRQCRWESVMNLSSYIQDSLEYNRKPRNFQQLKESVYTVETSAICWAQEVNSDNSCYFVTAQKNSRVLFWQLCAFSEPVLKNNIESNLCDIQNMLWIKISNSKFWLICANVMGQVNILEMSIKDGAINLQQSHELWKHADRMIGSRIKYMKMNANYVIFYAKHRHLVVQLIDQNCNILSQHVNNVNDFRIADITESIDGFYLSTINVKIYKLIISAPESNLNVELNSVALKDSYQTYELYSLSFSNNNTMAILGMIDRKVHCRKEVYKIDVIFVTTESMLEAILPKLLDNPNKKLTQYWDCIEVLRYKIMKSNLLPVIDYASLYAEGTNDIYKLKIYLIILTIYANLRKMAWMPRNSFIPESSVEAVKEKILLLHAQSNLNCLYKKHKKDGILNTIEEEILYGSVKYLNFYAKKNKTEMVIDDSIYGIYTILQLKNEIKYTCQSCDDIIYDFTCKSGHLNMYCILSFTPITNDDYLLCRSCGSTARTDLACEPLCVFCDQLLVKLD